LVIADGRLGRYRIEAQLGSGAFATVWLARDEALDSLVAIKLLADNWAYRADVRARFIDEARLLRRADSDRLVRVFDISELPGEQPYFVMSYANGGTLADRLAAGPLDIEQALETGIRIAQATAVLNEAGIIHRDLKPSNVLFHDPGTGERVLLGDLGLAKETAHASGFTVAAGTPGYRAPEQARPGGGLDIRADVYGVAALTYHMLTGRPPEPVTGDAGAAETGVTASALPSGVPEGLDRVLASGLAADPDARFPTATALARELATCRAGAGTPRRRKGPRPRTLAAFSVIALLVAAVVCFGALRAGGVRAAISAVAGDPGPTRVRDVTGTVSVTVPETWHRPLQLRDSGWNPASVGLASAHAPGLVVSPDLAHFADAARADPGIFVGESSELTSGRVAARTVIDHPRCHEEPTSFRYQAGGLTGHVQRWTRCAGGPVSFAEAVLHSPHGSYGVYVQIKQTTGDGHARAHHAREILDGLRVARP
jgi:hypothetical protein